MAKEIQMYTDESRSVKAYPKTKSECVYVDNNKTVKDKLGEIDSALDKNVQQLNKSNYLNDNYIYDLINSSYFLRDLPKVASVTETPLISESTTQTLTGTIVKAWNDATNSIDESYYIVENLKTIKAGTTHPLSKFVKQTGMTGASLKPPLQVEFIYNGDEFEFITQSYTNTTMFFDEGNGWKRLSDVCFQYTLTSTYMFVKVKFPNAKSRHIKMCCREYFGGIVCKTGFAVSKPSTTNKKIAFIGSSITEGSGSGEKTLSYPYLTSEYLGLSCINDGIGATGYIADGNGTRTNYITRVKNDVIDFNPDYIVIEGGINEPKTEADMPAVRTAVDNLLKYIKTNSSAKIIVIGVFSPRNAWSEMIRINSNIRDVVLSNGVPFIDLINGETINEYGNVITTNRGQLITGSSINNTDGNCYMYISNDTTHPNKHGHLYISKIIGIEIYKLINS